MEQIEIPVSIENEVKIAKAMDDSGKSRDEVIASAISSFLSSMGL